MLTCLCRYTRYREEQKRLHDEWLERKKLRDEKIAKGEKVGPEEKDPTAQEEVGLLGLLKFIVYCLLFLALVSKFFTGSFAFDLENNIPSLKKFWPVSLASLTPPIINWSLTCVV